jgi:hypothetical protein
MDSRPYELVHCTLQECLNRVIDRGMIRGSLDIIEAAREPHLLAEQHGGTWGEHPDHSRSAWRLEVEAEGTSLGYWDWVIAQIEQADEDEEET